MSRQFHYLQDGTQTFIGKNGFKQVFKAACHKPIWNGAIINTSSHLVFTQFNNLEHKATALCKRIYLCTYFQLISESLDQWIIRNHLGLGHETMVCTVCFSIMLGQTHLNVSIHIIYKLNDMHFFLTRIMIHKEVMCEQTNPGGTMRFHMTSMNTLNDIICTLNDIIWRIRG